MSSETEVKTVSLPLFSGKKEDYSVWRKRFMAYANIKKFGAALVSGFNLPTDPEKLTGTDEHKNQMKKNVVMNNLAVACLTMALQTEDDLDYLNNLATKAYEDGIAHGVVTLLRDAHRPSDRLTAVEAETEMRKVQLNDTDDPDEYFKKVSVVRSKYKNSKTFDESTLIANVMAGVSECYQDTIAQELVRRRDKVTLDNLKDALKIKWRITTRGTDKTNNDTKGEETTLSLNDEMKCERCGKKGHDTAHCWETLTGKQLTGKKSKNNQKKRSGGGGKKFGGKCSLCQKVGHKEKDCWLKEANASKRPANWKMPGNTKTADAGLDIYLLCCGCDEDAVETNLKMVTIMLIMELTMRKLF